jgi:hypothetical protein
VVLDNIEIMFPRHGLTDCQLGLQVLDQLQKQQDDEPVIVRSLFYYYFCCAVSRF